ncbi:hypothetical protein BaRGS_00033755 [Batillaria attramentaria]|uniref:Palmitoyltransferase n=1 Tax=Batillaria attramentaria TaxID=370345 RepID=A0ABD0JJR4_9CAEN
MENTMNGMGEHDSVLEVPLKPPKKKSGPVEDGVVTVDCTPFCRRIGFVRCASAFRNVWFVKDICGLVCAIITWLLLLYAEYVVMVVMLLPQFSSPYNLINAVVYNFFAFLALSSHLRTMLTDPGAVPKGNATRENIMKLGLKDGQVVFKCPKCVSIKPDRAHHCSVCQRCIRKMDHHCPLGEQLCGREQSKIFYTFYIVHMYYILPCPLHGDHTFCHLFGERMEKLFRLLTASHNSFPDISHL